EILAARVAEYEPAWLDDHCLAGRTAWARLRPRNPRPEGERGGANSPGPVRTTPITFLARRNAPLWGMLSPASDPAQASPRALARRTRAAQGEPPHRGTQGEAAAIEHLAHTLLRRYGVVFWRVLEREAAWLPPWRDLLRVYRRLEARGEIRGGRFVAGFSGEQYALPEAVGTLRRVRRTHSSGALVAVGAADPLNMAGILTPGARVPPAPANRVLYEDGVPIAVLEAKEIRLLTEMSAADQWRARNALLRRHVPPKVRAYLSRAGRTVSPPQASASGVH